MKERSINNLNTNVIIDFGILILHKNITFHYHIQEILKLKLENQFSFRYNTYHHLINSDSTLST